MCYARCQGNKEKDTSCFAPMTGNGYIPPIEYLVIYFIVENNKVNETDKNNKRLSNEKSCLVVRNWMILF